MNLHATATTRRLTRAILGGLLLLTAACGSTSDDEPASPAGAACLVGTPDCDDADLGRSPDEAPPAGETCLVGTSDCDDADLGVADGTDTVGESEEDRRLVDGAHAVLGLYETDLPAEVRVARRGAETMALTEDHVVGRVTVDLDDTDGSGFRVVAATVELAGGSATIELTPG